MKKIDLNVDIGEGFPFDEALLEFATSANICCGEHAGSLNTTADTVALCARKKVRIGIHPGYPDRDSMGRRSMAPGEERAFLKSIFDQVERFVSMVEPDYLKPHGAFYNDTGRVLDPNWQMPDISKRQSPYEAGGYTLGSMGGAGSLGMLLRIHRIPLMGLAPTAHAEIARRARVPLIREGFADRAYQEDGTLVPRSQLGAVHTDPNRIRRQVLWLAERVDSICLHGDTPGCIEAAEDIVRTLRDAGYEVGV